MQIHKTLSPIRHPSSPEQVDALHDSSPIFHDLTATILTTVLTNLSYPSGTCISVHYVFPVL